MTKTSQLVESLKNLECCAYDYNIDGEVLGMKCGDFEHLMLDSIDMIEKLSADRDFWKRRAEIAELQKGTPKWISIEDQLPPLGEIVLLTNGAHMEFIRTNSSSRGPNCIVGVTHWMRPPELPNSTRK